MNDKEVSVIIPAKNEEKYLPKLLKSLLYQEGLSKIEIIVSLAPSTTDNTALIAQEYGCKVVSGGRPATARNNGANAASYNTLFFLDADTYPENKDFLLKAFNEFYKRDLDIAGTFLEPDFLGNKIKKWIYKQIYNIENYMFLKRENSSKPKMQSGMFFRKNIFFKLYGFKEDIFGEDSEIVERAVNKPNNFKFGVLRNCGMLKNSVRRYEKEGIIKTLLKFLYLNAKAEIFGYDSLMGVYDKFYVLR